MHCNTVLIPKEFRAKRGRGDNTEKISTLAGLKFIELHHVKGKSKQSIAIKMFQHAQIQYFDKAGPGHKQGYSYQLSTFPNSDIPMKSSTQTIFKPDEFSGNLEGWTIDTPFNRKQLASCYFLPRHQKFCVIVDKDIDKEIGDLAIKLGYNKTIPKRDTDVIKKHELKIAQLQHELELAKSKERGEVAMMEGTEALKAMEEGFKATARAEILEENKIDIEKLKKKHKSTGAFFLSKEYKEKYIPLIEARTSELLVKRKS